MNNSLHFRYILRVITTIIMMIGFSSYVYAGPKTIQMAHYLSHPDSPYVNHHPHHYHYVPLHTHVNPAITVNSNLSYWTPWQKVSRNCFRRCLIDRIGRTVRCTNECN
jgi:hypothetical protein